MAATECSLCGKDPAEGFAMIDTRRYCHGVTQVEGRTCYERAQALDMDEALLRLLQMPFPGGDA